MALTSIFFPRLAYNMSKAQKARDIKVLLHVGGNKCCSSFCEVKNQYIKEIKHKGRLYQ